MSTELLVSVVIPFYNTPERFIREAVESVFSQTYRGWEILLIDDGSTDDITAKAMHYSTQYPEKVRYFEHDGHQNRGASASRNLALRHARGEYVAFLDADDVWLPNKLGEQVAIMDSQPEAAMLYGNTLYWHSWTTNPEDFRRDFMPNLGVQPDSLVRPPKLLSLFLRGKAAVPCTCSVMVRLEMVRKVGGFEDGFPNMYDDQVFYAKVCLAAPVFVASACWDRYRQHPDSSCHRAIKTGHYNPGRPHPARLSFLRWLESYMAEQRIEDCEVWLTVQGELQRYCRTGWMGLGNHGRHLLRRTRKLLSRLSR